MGFRTVVMLNNDFGTDWTNDPTLGRKIAYTGLGSYGDVVQVVHADVVTLAVLKDYSSLTPLASTYELRSLLDDDPALRLLQDAARERGYKLVKHDFKRFKR